MAGSSSTSGAGFGRTTGWGEARGPAAAASRAKPQAAWSGEARFRGERPPASCCWRPFAGAPRRAERSRPRWPGAARSRGERRRSSSLSCWRRSPGAAGRPRGAASCPAGRTCRASSGSASPPVEAARRAGPTRQGLPRGWGPRRSPAGAVGAGVCGAGPRPARAAGAAKPNIVAWDVGVPGEGAATEGAGASNSVAAADAPASGCATGAAAALPATADGDAGPSTGTGLAATGLTGVTKTAPQRVQKRPSEGSGWPHWAHVGFGIAVPT